jgi:hypothetical protein
VVVAITSGWPRLLEAGWPFDVFDAAGLGVEVEEIKEVEKVVVGIELEPDNPESCMFLPLGRTPSHKNLMLSYNSRIGYRSFQMLSRYK